VWDAVSGKERATLTLPGVNVADIAFNSDGLLLAVVSTDGAVRIWDWHEKKTVREITKVNAQRVAFGPHGANLVLWQKGQEDVYPIQCDLDQSHVKVKDLSVKGVFKQHMATFDPTGERFVLGDSEGNVTIWDAVNHEKLLWLRGPTGPVNAAVFSPDGDYLFTLHQLQGSQKCQVKLWNGSPLPKSP
jgi:WD40 repeat protein